MEVYSKITAHKEFETENHEKDNRKIVNLLDELG